MPIEDIIAFEYMCTPMIRETTSIRSVLVVIYARDRTEADRIFYSESHKFFENDINLRVNRTMTGYRETKAPL